MTTTQRIIDPTSSPMDELCRTLAADADADCAWPSSQLSACAERGVFAWFAPAEWQGRGWSGAEIVEGYLRLSAACLTTSFVLTQLTGALRRIVASQNEALKQRVLPDLVSGERIATLGISHLTTSRQHLRKPVLMAEQTAHGFVLNGFSPWVTGAPHVDYVLTGAAMADGSQIVVLVPAHHEGVSIPPPESLVALNGSCTGRVEFSDATVGSEWVLDGPATEIMKQATGAQTGGLQTSTLAIGLASAAIEFVQDQASRRADLINPAEQLNAEWERLCQSLRLAATGDDQAVSNIDLRSQANSLVLRATQAALSAAKGAGFVQGHPAGRWCREALFFLVWSCPQQVVDANLCEFAGMKE